MATPLDIEYTQAAAFLKVADLIDNHALQPVIDGIVRYMRAEAENTDYDSHYRLTATKVANRLYRLSLEVLTPKNEGAAAGAETPELPLELTQPE